MRFYKILSLLVLIILLAPLKTATAQQTRLLRMPAISENHVAFVYANDIWLADRDGSNVHRLTTFEGAETEPHFSPDGQWVAFSGQYDGNTDVFVVGVNGGEPRRLTWHPFADIARGWTVDGSAVVFASGRTNAPVPIPRFWTIALDESFPEALPLPRLQNGKFSPNGAKMAYEMVTPWESEFRNYRGGQNNPIRIIDLESLDVEKLPWDGTKDQHPNWIDDTVFFLSDRDFTVNVWAYSTTDGTLEQRTFFEEFDVKNLESGGGSLIFENGGYLYTLDAQGGEPARVPITINGDFSWARPHWESVGGMVQNMDISPNGKRVVFEARGEIFTVPAEHGATRNLTNSSDTADRAPAWSPDGQHIAWFSDASGEYKLVVADQFGKDVQSFDIPNPTFFYNPDWAPNSRHIAFTDMDQNLWVFDTKEGEGYIVDNAMFSVNRMSFDWSPDSKWLAYSRMEENQYHSIYVHNLANKASTAITDGMASAISPEFDASGKYMYFLSSINYGLNVGWLDMTSYDRPEQSSVHVVVLAADEPSPVAPKSDDEAVKEADEDEEEKEEGEEEAPSGVEVTIDFDGLTHRIIALDVPTRSYRGLIAGSEGTVFLAEAIENQPGVTLQRYKMADRELDTFMAGVQSVAISDDGTKMLVRSGGGYQIVGSDGGPNPSDGSVNTSDMRTFVDPAAEWKQMYAEGIRLQRDLLYVENVHGLDLEWVKRAYGPMLDHVRHRSDLTYLLDILGGETSIGHSFAGGGDVPSVERVSVGLLGADIVADGEFYQIKKILHSDPWTNGSRAPLSGPGIDVNEGDYLLAVNGQRLRTNDNFFSRFEHTVNKETVLTLSSNTRGDAAREVKVYPVPSEVGLRTHDWVESNRKKVDELSNGQLAYVWLPNTGRGGYNNFNRYYFAQKHKKGAVIDERYNGGGSIADYIVDYLDRDLQGYFNNNVGDKQPFTVPNGAIFGPKVMIINERAGSGGDMLPYLFKQREVGPLIGTKTWGGLVGWGNHPPLIDGGFVGAPWVGFYNLNGEWDVENIGVAPDIEVDEDPKLSAAGRDAQLERAVQEALRMLETEAVELLPQPADPVRVKRAGQ
ncbi:MAG: PDZ domain-containing protein [Bacteroidota bacterium]